MVSIFDEIEVQRKCLNEFLKNKFGDREITRDDLLSISMDDIKNKKINKSKYGSMISLYNWHQQNKSCSNTYFSILVHISYAKNLDISENDVKRSRSKRLLMNRNNIHNLDHRRCMGLFLKSIFGDKEITKEDLLSLGTRHYTDPRLDYSKRYGTMISLYNSLAKERDYESLLFSILKKTGYADQYNISEEDVNKAYHLKMSNTRISKQNPLFKKIDADFDSHIKYVQFLKMIKTKRPIKNMSKGKKII